MPAAVQSHVMPLLVTVPLPKIRKLPALSEISYFVFSYEMGSVVAVGFGASVAVGFGVSVAVAVAVAVAVVVSVALGVSVIAGEVTSVGNDEFCTSVAAAVGVSSESPFSPLMLLWLSELFEAQPVKSKNIAKNAHM